MSVPALVELAKVLPNLVGKPDPPGEFLGDPARMGTLTCKAAARPSLDGLGQFRGRRLGEKTHEGANEGFDDFRLAGGIISLSFAAVATNYHDYGLIGRRHWPR